ncbi:reprolysin-like metallopeptidase [Sinomicrobium soli]|uniref:reprolysin-like metallopeptidase n=1 Tax=Sinomicrobium sp. N-1-3-6 TaxID=2219864 RepID=UPI0013749F24|nr:zinc-dependent metalloprotease family protein [Sinomicrobium sp. N-1-3-6]
MKRPLLLLFLGFLLISFPLGAQESPWQKTALRDIPSGLVKNAGTPDGYLLRSDALRAQLGTATSRSLSARSGGTVVSFPVRHGGTEAFRISETPVLSPALAGKYPGIRSYRGVSLQHPGTEIRFSMDHLGLHATVHDAEGTYYLNPSETEKDRYYLASRQDFSPYEKAFTCAFMADARPMGIIPPQGNPSGNGPDDGVLRTYRMALACTGEFAQYHIAQAGVTQGTDTEKKAAVLAAMNTIMTRVNGIYARDLSVFLQLVDHNDTLIFLDPDTDGMTNDRGRTLIEEIQPIIDSLIGADHYDIGHVFSTGAGGIAELGSLCTENKARGVTGTSSPIDDPFAIDYVAHEIGHQFGATHTFNNYCGDERSNHTAVEPGSGSTIMGYAGICPPNIQVNSDAYFHAVSISQVWEHIASGSCAITESTGNLPPAADAGDDRVIPAGTPFVLTGTASDPDGDVLTYSWEQADNQIYEGYPDASSPGGPLFRSYPPSEIPERYFPRPEDIFSGSLSNAWEVLPATGRELNFSFLVRDGHPGGGQTGSDRVRLTVTADAGPFTVSSHNTTATLTAGHPETVTWDVAGTHSGAIGAETTDIFLLPGNDLNNRVLLAEGVPNSGEATVVVPGGISTSEARIMVKPADQVFFAVNGANLTVVPADYTMDFEALSQTACTGEEAVYTFVYHTYNGFPGTTLFSATAPEGIDVTIDPESATADGTEVTVTASGSIPGTYTLQLTGTSGDSTPEIPLTLTLHDTGFAPVALTLPENGATDIPPEGVALEWEAPPNAGSYEIQLSETPDFATAVQQDTVAFPVFRPSSLRNDRTYYWRVRPLNPCGAGAYGSPFSFSTPATGCHTYTSSDTVVIPENSSGTVTSVLEITDNDMITGGITVSLDITHSWAADLTVTLTSPSGTAVRLFSDICPGSENINAVFSDAGAPVNCNNNPAIGGTVRPEQALTAFRGERTEGTWTLSVTDNHISDGGTINAFGITRCPDPAADNFVIETAEVSCEGNSDGIISVTAMVALPYQVTISGNGIQHTEDFTETWSAENLPEGTYELCFTVTGNSSFRQCHETAVAISSGLSVIPVVHGGNNTLELQMDGGHRYTISLNGTVTETDAENIILPLEPGENILSVVSEQDCQGTYETRIFFAPDDIVVYPNPFTGPVYARIGNDVQGPFHIRVYNLSGVLMASGSYEQATADIPLELQGLSPGAYIISIKGKNLKKTVKVIKSPQ